MAPPDAPPIQVLALRLTESGPAEECGWSPHLPDDSDGFNIGVLNAAQPGAESWLESQSGIEPLAQETMLNRHGRPSVRAFGERLLVTLRGINLSEGEDPEDMVTLRVWLESTRALIVHHDRVRALEDLLSDCRAGNCVASPGAVLSHLTGALLERMQPFLDELADRLDLLEDSVIDPNVVLERGDLIETRRQLIAVRRHLLPQRETLARLYQEKFLILGDQNRLAFRESAMKMTRFVEDLDSGRERAAVVQEELSSQLAEIMNERMYLFTVVAGIFLPLSFLTGLFGINVAGMPWIEHPLGFWLVAGLCLGFSVLAWLLLRRRRWV